MTTEDPPGDAVPTYYAPGSRQYGDATSPHNATATQRPAAVAVPTSADDVAAAVRDAGAHGWRVLPQATGHGATGDVGPDTLLVDTSAIDHVDIDPSRRIARVGAGATWAKVNAVAAGHGLVGLSGSAPDVGVSGYTFGGGVGWFVRAYGMASGALRTVRYVGGDGNLRTAADGVGGVGGDAIDTTDREALWAFRGAGGVGVAVELELDLFPVGDLWAGYALWPIEHLGDVTGAWATALPDSGPALATSISVLHTPPAPPFPDHLRGQPVVHLAVASPAGGGRGRAPARCARRGRVSRCRHLGADRHRRTGRHPPRPTDGRACVGRRPVARTRGGCPHRRRARRGSGNGDVFGSAVWGALRGPC